MQFNPMEDYTKDPEILNKFGRNIVDLVKKGKIDPVIGREEEIRRIIKILSRKTKNNPVLIGEPGVVKQPSLKDLQDVLLIKMYPLVYKTK